MSNGSNLDNLTGLYVSATIAHTHLKKKNPVAGAFHCREREAKAKAFVLRQISKKI